jgi:hypothetical protein
MQRLEQVGLAGTVWPDGEHEPRQQTELETLVGAEVAEPNVLDNQTNPAA